MDYAIFIIVCLAVFFVGFYGGISHRKTEDFGIVSHCKEGEVWYPVVRCLGEDIVLNAEGIIRIGKIIDGIKQDSMKLKEKVEAQDERLALMGDAIYKATGTPKPRSK